METHEIEALFAAAEGESPLSLKRRTMEVLQREVERDNADPAVVRRFQKVSHAVRRELNLALRPGY